MSNRYWRNEHVSRALSRVERETELLRAEVSAFQAFQTAVDELSSRTTSGSNRVPMGATRPHATTGDVRDAYRETVVETDYYHEEYSDDVAESLASEFGALGTVLCEDQPLTASLKRQTLRAVEETIEGRASLCSVVRDERDDLEQYDADLREIGNAFLRRTTVDVEEHARRLDEIAARRQHRVRAKWVTGGERFEADTVVGYLYRTLNVDYPVLADVADIYRTFVVRSSEYTAPSDDRSVTSSAD